MKANETIFLYSPRTVVSTAFNTIASTMLIIVDTCKQLELNRIILNLYDYYNYCT